MSRRLRRRRPRLRPRRRRPRPSHGRCPPTTLAEYGYNLARTRSFPHAAKLGPRLRVGWRFHDGALLEFPAVIYDNTLYFEDINGWASALSSTTGRLLWHRRLGTLAAASWTPRPPRRSAPSCAPG